VPSQTITTHLENVLKHLYINPLERCNLACKICYTKKTKFVLSNQAILDFVKRYQQVQELDTITFCGGEVFLLKDFPALVNQLTKEGLFVQIISNGTIDRLTEIEQPNSVNFIVSLDGLEAYHDQNRGQGNFAKSTTLLKKAISLGFHTEVFSIVTKNNLSLIDEFEASLQKILGQTPPVTYHPRKPRTYLQKHPISNVLGQVRGFDFLSLAEVKELMQTKKTFPPQNLGCYQVSLMSDGRIYGCCEGITPLGDIQTDTAELVTNLRTRIGLWDGEGYHGKCLGCVEKSFVCGVKENLMVKSTSAELPA
jgi:organic radical activating enzyme